MRSSMHLKSSTHPIRGAFVERALRQLEHIETPSKRLLQLRALHDQRSLPNRSQSRISLRDSEALRILNQKQNFGVRRFSRTPFFELFRQANLVNWNLIWLRHPIHLLTQDALWGEPETGRIQWMQFIQKRLTESSVRFFIQILQKIDLLRTYDRLKSTIENWTTRLISAWALTGFG